MYDDSKGESIIGTGYEQYPQEYDPIFLGPPVQADPMVKGGGVVNCSCYYGNAYIDENGNCACDTGGVILGPPLLACEDGYTHQWLANGEQTCVRDTRPPVPVVTTTVITGTPTPLPPVVVNPDGTITHGTPTGILDGIIGEDGTIFGFSPIVLGVVVIGGYMLMSGGKGK